MQTIISGIQQIGIGVHDVHLAFDWYRKYFNMDVRIFEEAAVAGLMLPYTGGEPQKRHAILALNMQGGGGFEIWQYTGRTPKDPDFQIQLGDLGIFITKMKCRNAHDTYSLFLKQGLELRGQVFTDFAGQNSFFIKDPFGNYFEFIESKNWFKDEKKLTGGVYGCIIGVTHIEHALEVYTGILGYDKVLYDKTGTFVEFTGIPGGNQSFRRILLAHSQPRVGAFSPVLGESQIELVQVLDREPEKIHKNRFWGDPGFIHLCFDMNGMEKLRQECHDKGFGFTVDSSNSFDMGQAAGHFSYIADPDGTLIEFVETHKVPVIKKIGWYIHLKKRDPRKSLPSWMLNALSLNRVK